MAHKGKLFPVGPRRDLNLNVETNNDGFANRYLVTLTRLPPGIGNALQGFTWDCGPQGVDPIDRAFWQSEPEIFAAFAFDIILTAAIVGGTTYTKRVQVREAISGVILILELANDPDPHLPEFAQLQTWRTVFRDPFFFTSDGFANQAEAVRKTWLAGPPH